MYSVYYGTFSVSAFSGSQIPPGGTTPAPYSVQAQTGCFLLELVQPVGGTTGQHRRPNATATPNPSDNSVGAGFPNFMNDNGYETEMPVANGNITQFTIDNLSESRGTGNGTFTLDTGATGTVTITGARNAVSALPPSVRRTFEAQQALRARMLDGHRRR